MNRAALTAAACMNRATLTMAACLFLAGNALALTWTITSVDGPGDVGAYSSIAFDPAGRLGISYCHAGNDDLKYAFHDGSSWNWQTVDAAGRTGWYTSLAFDADGNPRIAYWDLTNSALRYARWNGSAWVTETVDNAGYVGQCCSLALDSQGRPAISYYDYHNGDLKYARWTGSAWSIEVVDDGQAGMGAGLYTSLVLDAADRPRIAYADHTLGQLRYAAWDGVAWSIEVVDGGTPIGTSLRLDQDGVPHISYAYQFGQGSHLKYAARNGTGGTWVTRIVQAGGQVGWYSSLRLLPDGAPRILSWDLGNGRVEYHVYEFDVWSRETIEVMGFTDQWTSLVLDDLGQPHATYRSASQQDLHYAFGSTAGSVPEGLSTTGASLSLRVAPHPVTDDGALVFRLARPGWVRVQVLDVLGREAVASIERRLGRGTTEVPVPAGLPSGVYFLRAVSEDGGRAEVRMVRTR